MLAKLPLAARAQPGNRTVGARQDFPDAGRHHHPDPDDPALVPVQFSRRTARCDPAADLLQHGRHAGAGAVGRFRADRL